MTPPERPRPLGPAVWQVSLARKAQDDIDGFLAKDKGAAEDAAEAIRARAQDALDPRGGLKRLGNTPFWSVRSRRYLRLLFVLDGNAWTVTVARIIYRRDEKRILKEYLGRG